MKVTIHQPNFCPYEGFWQKMKAADIFVFMVHAQFRKGGYETRFDYMNKWHTMSVNKGLTPLVTKEYLNPEEDWNRILKEFPQLETFTPAVGSDMVNMNMNIIIHAARLFGIKTKFAVDYPTELRGTERLVDICQKAGATEYISGPSGKKYLDVEAFKNAGIKVSFFEPTGTRAFIELIKQLNL